MIWGALGSVSIVSEVDHRRGKGREMSYVIKQLLITEFPQVF